MKNLKIILSSFKEMQRLEKRMIPSSVLVAVVSAIMPFINIWFTSKIVDLLDTGAESSTLIVYILIAVGLNLILFFINNFLGDMNYMFRSIMYNRENQNIASKLYSIEYQKLEDSEFKELLHNHSEAQKRVYSAFTQFSWMLRDFLSGLITFSISIIILFPLFKIGFTASGPSFFERPIFLITLFLMIVIMVAVILAVNLKMNKAQFVAGAEYSRLDKLFYFFLNVFQDYNTAKEIRLYKEQELIEHVAVDKIVNNGEKILRRVSLNSARSSSMIAVLGAIAGFGVYLFIGVKGFYGLYGIGSLVLSCGAFMQIISGIMKMAATFGRTAELIPLAEYYFKIINTKDEMQYGEKTFSTDKFEVEFKNVSFKYPGSENYALKNINIKINNGEHLAVVGKNGSGKTTFIKLLCRFYDVNEGEIKINGINIKDYSKDSINKLYSVVFQDFKLFSIPVCQNLSTQEDYQEAKLFDALDKVGLLNRIMKMPDREKTYIYKDLDKSGIEISGGEAQRLAIARAHYKDAPIVILDEPTASLDPVAEKEIYDRFNQFVENKTAIYISHRLSSCVFCDRIAVFENARLVESGYHQELLSNKDSKYFELWDVQAQYYKT
ncbi:MAG: ABC transporter ATP-binding protein [Clostridia bacterium]|nr:ABC transporter ATP-binding protein [Clostridia bacterium]